jgi:prepilin-type processing-associated H-X9-DG protein
MTIILGRRKGLTLPEILTVVAIIFALLVVLLPALATARKQGGSTECKDRLHSWGKLWQMYVADNDGKFAPGNQIGSARSAWFFALHGYWVEKKEILKCPIATERQIKSEGVTLSYGSNTHTYIHAPNIYPNEASYGFNLWLYSVPVDCITIQGRPRSLHWPTADVENSEEVPLFLDSMWRGGGPWYGDVNGRSTDPSFPGIRPPEYDGQWIRYDNEMMHFALDRHNKGVNAAFMDGTVRYVAIKKLWDLKWHRKYEASKGYIGEWPEWMGD